MLRKTMIVLATAAALTGGVNADAFALGWSTGGWSDSGYYDPWSTGGWSDSGYYDPWYSGYYDPSTVAPDEQPTYPAPVVPPPPAPDAKVVSNPHSGVPSEEPDLLRPGELLVRFPPPKKILR